MFGVVVVFFSVNCLVVRMKKKSTSKSTSNDERRYQLLAMEMCTYSESLYNLVNKWRIHEKMHVRERILFCTTIIVLPLEAID